MRLLRFSFLLLTVIVLTTTAAIAQYDAAAVLGTVSDSSGSVVPGSNLKLTNTATGVVANRTANKSGEYEFTGVLPGNYTLTVKSPGFATETTTFSVTVGARQRVDMRLRPGGTTEVVMVTSAAAQLETDTSENGFTVQPVEVMNLPLNGREYADLAKLTPGVRTSLLENETTTSRDASYNVNGLRSSWNDFILDGLDNNNYGVDNQGYSNQAVQPVLDAVNEFSVTTDNYSAEYGRVGGAVINVATKSGTAHFHGAAWDYIRNPAVNAVGPFPLTPGSVPGPQQNQFGGVLGGPLPLHVLTHTGKTFFFVDYEALRWVEHSPVTATLPTPTQINSVLNGAPFLDSSGRAISIENPYTDVVYTNGIIPAPNALAQIALTNLENAQDVPGQTVVAATNYTADPAAIENSNKDDARLDWAINDRQSLFFRYSNRSENVVTPSPVPGPDYGDSTAYNHRDNQQIVVGYTKVMTAQSALDARIGYTWSHENDEPFDIGTDNIPVAAGIPNAPSNPEYAGGLDTQTIEEFTAIGRDDSDPTEVNPNALDAKVGDSWLHGKHSFKFGYEYQHIDILVSNTHPQDGHNTYKGLFSEGTLKALTLSTGATDPAYKQAWALADFAFGAQSEYELSNQTYITENIRMHAAYMQDDWRALPGLTLNLGLRYEFTVPTFESHNELSNFDPGTQQLILASPGSMYNRALVHPNPWNLAPRLGLAWSVNPKTVMHAAYGIGYVQWNRVAGANELAGNLPISIDVPISQYAPDSKTGAQQLCTGPTPLPNGDLGTCFVTAQQGWPDGMISPPTAPYNLLNNNPTYVPAHTPTSYVETYMLNVERQLAKNLTLTVGYVGSHGVHELILADWNQAVPNNAAGTETLASRRPYNGTLCCGDVSMAFNEGASNYNALQAKLEKRYSYGLYFINSFTWSKAMDQAAGHLETEDGDTEYVNLYNMAGDYGRSSYDQALNETLAVTYDLPYGAGRKFGANAPYSLQLLAGGWQVSFINQATSGLPTNLTYDETVDQEVDESDLSGYYRANVTGNPVLPQASRVKTSTYLSYLNPATVSAPTANNMPFGDAQRNSVTAPAYETLDLSLHKRFRLWSESSALEVRIESYNALNRANYQAPDGDVSDTTFGQITTAYPAREMQGALKLIF